MTEINRDRKSPSAGRATTIGVVGALGGLALGAHVLQKNATAQAAKKAAEKSQPLLSKIMGGVKNIASPNPTMGTVGLIGTVSAALFYRKKIGGALSKIFGNVNIKDIPSKLTNSVKGVFSKPKTPVDSFVKEGKESLNAGLSSFKALKGLFVDGLKTCKNVAEELNPLKEFLK